MNSLFVVQKYQNPDSIDACFLPQLFFEQVFNKTTVLHMCGVDPMILTSTYCDLHLI